MRHMLAAFALAIMLSGAVSEATAHMAGCESKYYLATDPQSKMDGLFADFVINREEWKTKPREELVALIFQLHDAQFATATAYGNFIFCLEQQR